MARFSTAEAKAIVHATLSFFWLESSIWAKEVCNSVDSSNGSRRQLPVDIPGVLIIWWIFSQIFGWIFGMDFRVFTRIFGMIFGMIRRRFRRAFRRIFQGTNFRVLIRIFGTIERRFRRRIFRGTFGSGLEVSRRQTIWWPEWSGSEQKTIWWWKQGSEWKWKHQKGSWVPEHVKESVEWVWKWNFQVDIGREPSRLHLCQHCGKHGWSCQWCAFCVNEWQSEYTVTDRVRDGCGFWKKHGKKSRSRSEHVGRALEWEGSR